MRPELESFVLYNSILAPEYLCMVCDMDHEIFSMPHTRSIHAAIISLYEAGAKIDPPLIRAEISRVGGTPNHLDKLIEDMHGKPLYTKDMVHTIWLLKDMAFRDEFVMSVRTAEKLICENAETKDVLKYIENTIARYSSPQRGFRIEDDTDLVEFFGKSQKIKTGISGIDSKLRGIYDSDLIILAARPGCGKTTMALNIMEYVIETEKKPVIIFSREMSKQQLLARIISKKTNVEYHSIIEHNMLDWEKSSVVNAWKDIKTKWKDIHWIDDRTSDISDIITTARMVKLNQKAGLVIIDYLGLCNAKGNNPNERMSNITRQLKLYAQTSGVPVLALAQLNRMVETRNTAEPKLSDLRDSGSIEQDANAVLFLWENADQEYYCTIAKNRSGECGRTRLRFDKAAFSISDYNYTYIQGAKP